MCSPTAGMFAVGMGLQIYGGMASARAQKEAGAAQRRYYNYLAKQNESDAAQVMKDAEGNVTSIQTDASRANEDLKRGVRQVEAKQKTALAASGVSLDSVTAEDLERDTFNKARLDAMAIRFNADTQSWETRKSAAGTAHQLRTNAIFNRMGGENAYQAGRRAAQATLIGTAGNVANRWYQWSQTSGGRTPRVVDAPVRPTGGRVVDTTSLLWGNA